MNRLLLLLARIVDLLHGKRRRPITAAEVWAQLEAIPGFNRDLREAERQLESRREHR